LAANLVLGGSCRINRHRSHGPCLKWLETGGCALAIKRSCGVDVCWGRTANQRSTRVSPRAMDPRLQVRGLHSKFFPGGARAGKRYLPGTSRGGREEKVALDGGARRLPFHLVRASSMDFRRGDLIRGGRREIYCWGLTHCESYYLRRGWRSGARANCVMALKPSRNGKYQK